MFSKVVSTLLEILLDSKYVIAIDTSPAQIVSTLLEILHRAKIAEIMTKLLKVFQPFSRFY